MVPFGIDLFLNKPFLTVLNCFNTNKKNRTPYICLLQTMKLKCLHWLVGVILLSQSVFSELE